MASSTQTTQLVALPQKRRPMARPHAQWQLKRVLCGHTGWVRSLAVDASNRWFASGAADRTIKIWDMAAGTLKLTLTGHIGAVRGLCVSERHPYLFSVGDDKMVKCWDLEQNKVVRQYHGHLSGIYAAALHPTLDLLATASRDATTRIWDLRTRQTIHTLTGHRQTVATVLANECRPQFITSSMDSTIRLWDAVAGKTVTVLTHHKRSVRALASHPIQYSFLSGGADHVKKWKLPEGLFMQDIDDHHTVINALAVNADGVLVSGGDNGSLRFCDWASGESFQSLQSLPQSGSLDCEAAIFAMTFDRSGLRLLTGEGDKTIKVWAEVEEEESLSDQE